MKHMSEERKIEDPRVKTPEKPPLNEQERILQKPEKEQVDINVENKPEAGLEGQKESPKEVSEKIGQMAQEDELTSSASAGMNREEREKEVESIMSAGLEESFLQMPEEKRSEFKQAGEETAQKINGLLDKAKVRVKKIVSLLKKWLSLLPGANKFFIEQEAKIRADKISKLKK